MERIQQKHSRGCGIAALSMLTGKSYEEVAVYFGEIDLDKHGVYLRGMDDYLVDQGFAIARKHMYLGFFTGREATLRKPWPPEPFADLHLCEVEVCENASMNHFAIMLRDGEIVDPLLDDRKALSDYFRVLNVAGIVKL
jgi:hypothetical protein